MYTRHTEHILELLEAGDIGGATAALDFLWLVAGSDKVGRTLAHDLAGRIQVQILEQYLEAV